MLNPEEIRAAPQLGKQWLEIDWDTGDVNDLEPIIKQLLVRLEAAEEWRRIRENTPTPKRSYVLTGSGNYSSAALKALL